MSFRARIQPILVFLCLTVLALQGCSVSSGDGDGGGGAGVAGDGDAINLELTTATGVLTLAVGGNDLMIQLLVTDGAGNGISGAEVRFTTNAGMVDGSTESTKPTDADGIATATLTSSDMVETATVIAEALGFSQAVQISFVSSDPATLELNAVENILAPREGTTLSVTVRDVDGNPVEGATVRLAITTNNSGASLEPTSGTTGPQGQILSNYTAGASLGTDVVRAELGSALFDTISLSVQTATVVPSDLQLLVSRPQLPSDGSATATLTAVLRDIRNNAVSGSDVFFSADSGVILEPDLTTDENGVATAIVGIGQDKSNRTINVSVEAGTLEATNTIDVTGTTLNINGVSALALTDTITLSLSLRDSAGDGIADADINVTSMLGNPVTPVPATSDFNGNAEVDVTANVPGNDTINASALGASATFLLTISPNIFRFTTPTRDASIPLGTNQQVVVEWLSDTGPVSGNVIFFITRGTLQDQLGQQGSSITVPTNASGLATVFVTADNAGSAVITAVGDVPDGPSSQLPIVFIAEVADSLVLQADPTTLGVNIGTATDQQSTVTAIVRDVDNNLVTGRRVSFNLNDSTGGRISPGEATTDDFGRASTVYTSGPTPSAQNRVIIEAVVVPDPDFNDTECMRDLASDPPGAPVSGPCARVSLTVAQQSVLISLGSGNTISEISTTQFADPFAVLVTDINNNPIENQPVGLSIFPLTYSKGVFVQEFELDDQGNPTDTFIRWRQEISVTCPNEDLITGDPNKDRNGLLDPGEDVNGNGRLDPGAVAEVPSSATTNADGFDFFNVVYFQDNNLWTEVELVAETTVAGSESSARTVFTLPGLAADFDDEDVAPPGVESPFGTGNFCDEDG